jgi:hypothetical protein
MKGKINIGDNILSNRSLGSSGYKEQSDENQTECHEIEPNPSKDRAMTEGDNPSF